MKTFTKTFVLFILFALFLQACVNLNVVQGSGKLVYHEVKISDYKEISMSGSGDIIYEYKPEKEPYLQLYVDDNLIDLIECETENGRLVVKSKKDVNINPSKFKIYTNSSELVKIRVAGSSDIHLKGEVNSKNLEISVAGSGSIASDSLFCETFSVAISGSGNVHLKGAANQTELKVSGSGKVKAFDFPVQHMTCHISGSGNMEVNVLTNLDVRISGSGGIKYKGNPQVNQRVSGSGSIQKVN